jgi:Ca2+-binding EF-hand superfamily protein
LEKFQRQKVAQESYSLFLYKKISKGKAWGRSFVMGSVGGSGYNYSYNLNAGVGQFLDPNRAYRDGKVTDEGMLDLFQLTSREMDQFSGGDNILSKSEFASMMGGKDTLFKAVDTDGDGQINQAELARFHVSVDKDHDGTITSDELNKFSELAKFMEIFGIKPKEKEIKEFDNRFNAFRNPPPTP